MLQDSLGGSGKTSIVVTIGPSPLHIPETESALKFGQRAMKVQTKAAIHQSVDYKALAFKLQADMDAFEKRNMELSKNLLEAIQKADEMEKKATELLEKNNDMEQRNATMKLEYEGEKAKVEMILQGNMKELEKTNERELGKMQQQVLEIKIQNKELIEQLKVEFEQEKNQIYQDFEREKENLENEKKEIEQISQEKDINIENLLMEMEKNQEKCNELNAVYSSSLYENDEIQKLAESQATTMEEQATIIAEKKLALEELNAIIQVQKEQMEEIRTQVLDQKNIISDLQEKLKQSQESERDLKENVSALNARIETEEGKYLDKCAELNEKVEELIDYKTLSEKNHKEYQEKTDNEISGLKTTVTSFEEEVKNLHTEITKKNEECATLLQNISLLELKITENNSNFEKNLKEMNDTAAQLEQDMNKLQQEKNEVIKKLEDSINILKKEKEDLVQRYEQQINNLITEHSTKTQLMEDQAVKIQAENTEKFMKIEEQLKKTQNEKENLSTMFNKRAEEQKFSLQSQEMQMLGKDQEISQMNLQILEFENKISFLMTDISSLSRALSEKERQNSELQKNLENSNSTLSQQGQEILDLKKQLERSNKSSMERESDAIRELAQAEKEKKELTNANHELMKTIKHMSSILEKVGGKLMSNPIGKQATQIAAQRPQELNKLREMQHLQTTSQHQIQNQTDQKTIERSFRTPDQKKTISMDLMSNSHLSSTPPSLETTPILAALEKVLHGIGDETTQEINKTSPEVVVAIEREELEPTSLKIETIPNNRFMETILTPAKPDELSPNTPNLGQDPAELQRKLSKSMLIEKLRKAMLEDDDNEDEDESDKTDDSEFGARIIEEEDSGKKDFSEYGARITEEKIEKQEEVSLSSPAKPDFSEYVSRIDQENEEKIEKLEAISQKSQFHSATSEDFATVSLKIEGPQEMYSFLPKNIQQYEDIPSISPKSPETGFEITNFENPMNDFVSKFESTISGLETTIQRLEISISKLELEKTQLNQLLGNEKTKNSFINKQYISIFIQKSILQTELIQTKKKLDLQIALFEMEQKRAEKLNYELETSKNSIKQLTTSVKHQEHVQQQLLADIDEFKKNCEEKDQKINELNQNLEKSLQKIEKLDKKKSALREKVENLSTEHISLKDLAIRNQAAIKIQKAFRRIKLNLMKKKQNIKEMELLQENQRQKARIKELHSMQKEYQSIISGFLFLNLIFFLSF